MSYNKETANVEQMKGVYYYNNAIYYNINQKNKHILLNKKGKHLKKCLIIDVTQKKTDSTQKEIFYGKKDFLETFKEYGKVSNEEFVHNILNTIKFKVYKKIKLK
jgi:hypothetical protein